ncbi:MAG: hypothetical protein J6R40_00805 [Clostridia bacterium]|nr:hypothetical protein [Clostridia bacterium]
MTKRKKIAYSVIAGLGVLLLCACAWIGVHTYQVTHPTFPISDTLPDGGGRKATVILLAGQSNAAGCSQDAYLKNNVSPEKYAEYEAGYDNVYINYVVSETNASGGFVKCAARQGEMLDYNGFGPELGMAEKLHETRPDELFFIIKYTYSGTALYDRWLPPSSKGKTGRLFYPFMGFVESSMKYLASKNYDVKIEGLCFMQGESDSFLEESYSTYGTNLTNFISDIRRRLSRYAAEDGIAFVDALIADLPAYWVFGDIVNEKKKEVAESSPLNVLIDTNAAGLTTENEPKENPDRAHYDSMSEIKLGHLFAEYLSPFLN